MPFGYSRIIDSDVTLWIAIKKVPVNRKLLKHDGPLIVPAQVNDLVLNVVDRAQAVCFFRNDGDGAIMIRGRSYRRLVR